jgi:hypothetical protein
MRRISKIRNLRSIGFSNLLIDKFYLWLKIRLICPWDQCIFWKYS